MKEICVIGLGRFGYNLSIELTKHKINVIAIDLNPERINAIAPYIYQAIVADASKKEVLSTIISESIDTVVVAIGHQIEVSILCTLHLNKMGIKKIIARAHNKEHAEILKSIGADHIILPEQDISERLAKILVNPNIIDFLPMFENYQIAEIVPPDHIINKSIKDSDIRNKYNVFIIAIKEYIPERIIVLPGAEFIIKDTDALIVFGKEDDIKKLREKKD